MASVLSTYKCDEQCNYCNIFKRGIPDIELTPSLLIELSSIFNQIHSDKETIMLTGGEPGLLSEPYLDMLFEIIPQQQVSIFTNGLFIKKGYSERYKHKIVYHVIHLIGKNDQDKIRLTTGDCTYIYIVTANNIDTLPMISNLYNDISIDLKLYESTQQDNDPLSLVDADFIKLKYLCDTYTNLKYKQTISKKLNPISLNSYIDLCQSYAIDIEIDLPKNRLNHCCNGKSSNFKITYDNYMAMRNGLIDKEKLNIECCDSCGLIRNQGNPMVNRLIKRRCESR